MGASLALAGMTACRWPAEQIVPFAHRPEGIVPGEPRHYATALELGGVAVGLARDELRRPPDQGRGQPGPPYEPRRRRGLAQAALLELYDPDRSQRVAQRECRTMRDWDEFAAFAREHFAALRAPGGAAIAVLAERELLAEPWPICASASSPRSPKPAGTSTSRGRTTRRARARAWPSADRCGPHVALDRAETIVCARRGLPAATIRPRCATRATSSPGATPTAGRSAACTSSRRCVSLTGSMADHRVAIPNRAIHAFTDRGPGASSSIEAGVRLRRSARRPARPCSRRRARIRCTARSTPTSSLDLAGKPRTLGRAGRAAPAGGGARARACAQRDARQRRPHA